MNQLDLRPLSIGEILDRTFTLFRRNFLLFIGITALPQLLSLAFQLTRTFVWGGGRSTAGLGLGVTVTATLLALAALVVTFIVALFAQAATFLAVNDLYLSRPVSVADCLRRALGEIGTVFGVGVLNGLAVVAGLIALIVPGIYIFCRLLVSVPAALVEGRGPSDAIRRSWWLEKDNVGRAFVLVALYFVISVAAAMLFQLPFTIASIAYKDNFAMLRLWTGITLVGDAIINIIVSPILLIATSVFYFDLRVRKEGFDLQFMMDPTSERSTPPGSGAIPSILS